MHERLGMWGLAIALLGSVVGCADVDAAGGTEGSTTAQQLWPGWPSSDDDQEDEDDDASTAVRPQGGDVDDDWFDDGRDVVPSSDGNDQGEDDVAQEDDAQAVDTQDADEDVEAQGGSDADDWADDEAGNADEDEDVSTDDRDVSSDQDEDEEDDRPWWGSFPWPLGGGPVIGGVSRR